MEIELGKKTIDAIAQRAALMLFRMMEKRHSGEEVPEMVTTAEAARILNITAGRMRQIKDRFPHVKGGDNQQGKLLFKRDALITTYGS